MSLFLTGFAALVALALAVLLPPLLRGSRPHKPASHETDAQRANLLILREQLEALEADHLAGNLDADQYRLARTEIERRVLEEEQDTAPRPLADRRAGKTAVAVAVLVPLFSFLVYGLVGDPEAMLPRAAPTAAGQGEITMPQIEAMVEKLAQRLENQTTPQEGDAQAWTMLARSYSVLQRYADASRAYGRARALMPEDAQMLADHADVMAMVQGQSVVGEPLKLVQRALQLDPRNLKALALAGSAAFERKDFQQALDWWGQAIPLAPPGSEFATGLQSSMQQARSALAASAPAGKGAAAQSEVAQAPAASSPAGAGKQVSGTVQLSAAVAARAAPDDTVFVFARAADGPRMPLAILKRKVSDLPLTFTLDDSSAMSPQMKLSGFAQVIVGARVSKSGDAMPRTGDLTGQVGPVATGTAKLLITIDGVQP
jgi:cytochrome c-type biogenesis protein CcmH